MVSVIKSLLLFTTFGAVYSEGDGKWGYVNITRDDVKAPDKWHKLDLKKPNHCGKNKQSPIDIKTSEVEEDSYRRLKITFDNTRGLVTGTLLNTGHSPELEIADSNGASLTGGPLGDKTFELLQFHVHFGCVNERGSEHKLDGKQLSGELHMVFGHDEERAVVALWIKVSSKGNKIFGKLANLMHHIIKPEDSNTYSVTKEDGIYLRDLIPKKCSIDKREDNGGNGGNGNGGNGNGDNGNGGNGNGGNGNGGNGNGGNGNGGNGKGGNGNGGNGNGGNGNGGNGNGGNGNGGNGNGGNGNGGNGNGGNGNGGNGNGGNGNGGNGNGGNDNGDNGNGGNDNGGKDNGHPKSLTLKCYFTYRGSLTTPPCTQTIRWIVVKDYLLASTSQLEKFRKLEAKYYGPRMCDNFRPVQNLNDRTVYSVTSEKNNDK